MNILFNPKEWGRQLLSSCLTSLQAIQTKVSGTLNVQFPSAQSVTLSTNPTVNIAAGQSVTAVLGMSGTSAAQNAADFSAGFSSRITSL